MKRKIGQTIRVIWLLSCVILIGHISVLANEHIKYDDINLFVDVSERK